MTADRPEWSRRLAAALVVVALAVTGERLLLAGSARDPRLFPKYLKLADAALAGEFPRQRLNDVSPGYLWFIYAAKKMGAGVDGIRSLQVMMTALAALIGAAAAWKLAGAVAGWAAAAVILGSQAVFLNATEFEPETLILLLNAAVLFVLVRRDGALPARGVAVGGFLLGASAAVRPTGLLMLLASAVWIALRARSDRREFGRRLAILAFASAVPLGAVAVMGYAMTGRVAIMNPGTVFYEGWNPHATGYASAVPLVVLDVQSTIDEPDPLHAAYRLVASRAARRPVTVEETNRYWREKALRFAAEEPLEAARLLARKAFLALHSYDAWDLAPLVLRDRDTSRRPWLPFGLAAAVAAAGAWSARRRPEVLLLMLLGSASYAVLILFYVTSRQRNAMIPAVAILAGIGVARFAAILAEGAVRRAAAAIAFVAIAALALGIESKWQEEDTHQWTAAFVSETLVLRAGAAERRGSAGEAAKLRALDGTWLAGDDLHIPSTPPPLLAGVARAELARSPELPRVFDLGLALLKAGQPREAGEVFAWLGELGYGPDRRHSAVRSLGYYRSLAELRSGHPEAAKAMLGQARAEAPVDADVLALSAVLAGDRRSVSRLFALHDPFTAELALARAELECGGPAAALHRLENLVKAFPEWSRGRLVRDVVRDRLAAEGAPNKTGAPESARSMTDDGGTTGSAGPRGT